MISAPLARAEMSTSLNLGDSIPPARHKQTMKLRLAILA